MTKEKALEILQRQVRGVNTMRGIRRFGASFTKWKRDTETAIREIFGHEHGHLVAFGSISYGANGWTVGAKTPAKEAEEEGAWQEGLEHAESILRSFIDEINDYWGGDGPSKAALPPYAEHGHSASLHNQDKKKVFVVHGRNSAARDAMFSFLRSLGLQPIEWSEAVQLTGETSPFIGSILDAAFDKAQAVVVLMTPDDVAYLHQRFVSDDDPPYEINPTPQARPNVLFEAGMAMGRYPDRTIIVELGSIRPFSDIGGRHVVRINNTSQRRQDLADRLSAARCDVNISGRDWHSAGDFEECVAFTVLDAIQGTPSVGASALNLADSSEKGDVISFPVRTVTLTSITVTPSYSSITYGHTLQFIATGHYSDGTSAVLSTEITWTSVNVCSLDSLRAYTPTPINSILLGDLSPLLPKDKLEEACTQFNDIFARAKLGDANAIGAMQSISTIFLTLSRQFYATSVAYFTDFETVKKALLEIALLGLHDVTTVAENACALASLRAFTIMLSLGDLGALSPESKLAEARTQFTYIANRAKIGDTEALWQLESVTTAFLNSSNYYFGGGKEYVTDFFDTVQQVLLEIQSLDTPAAPAAIENESGLATGVAVGTAIITARSGSISGTAVLTITV